MSHKIGVRQRCGQIEDGRQNRNDDIQGTMGQTLFISILHYGKSENFVCKTKLIVVNQNGLMVTQLQH